MFAQNLKALRQAKGFSQEQLAVRLHVVRQTISKWEKGLSVPDAALLLRLAEVLNVPVSDLLGGPIAPEGQADDLAVIAAELQKLNELLAAGQAQREAQRKQWIAVAQAALLVLVLLAVYDRWNDLFYAFGQTLYRFLHG